MTRSQSSDDRFDPSAAIVLPSGVTGPQDLPVELTLYSRFVQRLHRRYADELPL